ncbi:uncharacterized protein LOC144352351 isoform X2 [Saccoglossus kowalevskii]
MPVVDLAYWLSKFFLEVRKVDGNCYPSKTLLSLIMGLQSYRCSELQTPLNVLSDKEFQGFRQVLDSEMKRLSSLGLESKTKQAEVFAVINVQHRTRRRK